MIGPRLNPGRVGIVCLVFFLILASAAVMHWRVAAGRLAWEKWRSAALAGFLDNRDANLLFEIGNYYFNGGAYDLEKAEAAYSRAGKIDSAFQGIHYQLARICFLKGDFKKAVGFINKEISLYPDFKRSYYIRGLANAYSDNLDEAERDFLSFLEFDPLSWAAHNDLAFVYWKKGDYQLMKKTAEKGLSFNPGNVWLLATLGNALLNLGDQEGALAALKKAESALAEVNEAIWRKAYPGHYPGDAGKGIGQMASVIYFNEGLIYERLHRPQDAIASLEKVAFLDDKGLYVDASLLKDKIASLKNQL